MNNTMNGLYYLLEGFKLIFRPGLKRYVIIPLIINMSLYGLLFWLSAHFFSQFTHWIEGLLPAWLQWLGSLLWLIFAIGYILIMIYTFVTLANIISAPFNSLLAEEVELLLTGKKIESASLFTMIKDIPRVIGRQLAILAYYIPRALGILILFFVPIVQMGAAVIWFLFNAWMMALQYMDYPMDNHRIPFDRLKQEMREKYSVSLSFGIMVLIATLIPILNFFIMPAAVAGATLFYVKECTQRPMPK